MIRLGLIGFGRWGRRYFETIEGGRPQLGVAITGICHPSAPHSHQMGEMPPPHPGRRMVTYYRRWEELVVAANQGAFHGVIIASPASSHYLQALSLISAKIPVLLEKPATDSIEHTASLAEIGRDRLCMMGHQHVHTEPFKRLVRTARLWAANLVVTNIDAYSGGPGPERPDCSIFWDWLPHELAMIAEISRGSIFSPNLRSVRVADNQRSAAIAMTCQGVDISISIANDLPEKARRFRVRFSNGNSLTYEDFVPRPLRIATKDRPDEYPEFPSVPPVDCLLADFINEIDRCREGQRPPYNDLPVASHIAKTIHGIEKAAKKATTT